jgi:hypothetical protein
VRADEHAIAQLLDRSGVTAADRERLATAKLVVGSGVRFADPYGGDRIDFQSAMWATTRTKLFAPQLVMVDPESHPRTGPELRAAGGIPITVPQDETGLMHPYRLAARILEVVAPQAIYCKAEGAKNLFQGRGSYNRMVADMKGLDVATGVRSLRTWNSMPNTQRETEQLIGPLIKLILGVSDDTPSGVLLLGPGEGVRLMAKYLGANLWTYLFRIPLLAKQLGLKVGEVGVDFDYDPDVVAKENNDEATDRKRCFRQTDDMVDGAIDEAGGYDKLSPKAKKAVGALPARQTELWDRATARRAQR